MLERLTPGQFQELVVATLVGLDPDGWKQMASLAAAICNRLEIGAEIKLSKPSDFLPHTYRELFGIEEDDDQQIEEAFEKAKVLFG